MTARMGSTSMDGTPISDTDRARIAAEDQLHDEHRRRAARVVAAASIDVEDCRMLLAMLGIDDVVRTAAQSPISTARSTAKRAGKRSVAA